MKTPGPSSRPLDIILRHALAEVEGLFAVEQYYGRPPGVILIGRFKAEPTDEATVAAQLKPFGYHTRFTRLPDGRRMVEVSPKRLEVPRRYLINVALFLATIVTTTAAGALQRGANLLEPAGWLLGIPFSAALMAILVFHEMGHYFASRRHGVRATLPYFIPMPNLFGTFGALIRMESPIPDRRALLDIGAAGPVAGFLIAVPLTALGLRFSTVVPAGDFLPGSLILGESLLFKGLTYLALGPVNGGDVSLHPLALAGWIGLWVTSMNLLPVGQLDGGHVIYALFGKFSVWVGRAVFVGLVAMGFLWNVYFFWALFLILVVRFQHPPPINDDVPLTPARRFLGWVLLVVFVVTFIPIPLKIL